MQQINDGPRVDTDPAARIGCNHSYCRVRRRRCRHPEENATGAAQAPCAIVVLRVRMDVSGWLREYTHKKGSLKLKWCIYVNLRLDFRAELGGSSLAYDENHTLRCMILAGGYPAPTASTDAAMQQDVAGLSATVANANVLAIPLHNDGLSPPKCLAANCSACARVPTIHGRIVSVPVLRARACYGRRRRRRMVGRC